MYIELKTNGFADDSKRLSFAIHSASPFSIIKLANIQEISQINKSEIHTLCDVIGGEIGTLGFVFINLNFKAFNILHKFYVVADDFDAMPENGTLALDFFHEHGCCLDFTAGKGDAIGVLTVRQKNVTASVKILEKKRPFDGTARILSYRIGRQQ